ncbi:DNA polymerase beta [Diachasma alloeum]|uniref:DNA polymerase beta n=1 Tax=Diachasma alloeum TaxID=454923 RepID=UPI00073831DA|nr:DNA polymerase beta [Diachasma alloeum]
MSKRKAPSDDNCNSDLCDLLTELANYERNITKNIYKANAYRKAASTLGHLSHRVKSGDEAKELPGIGEKIAKKIDEFLTTGKLQKLENINKDENNIAINLLTRVSGIGPAKAKELVDSGIKTLEELYLHENLLTHHQKLGLKYFADFEKKIPRVEMEELEQIIRETILKYDDKYIISLCGSYRRAKSESGDIDVLITHPSFTSSDKELKKDTKLLNNVVDRLREIGFIKDTISLGPMKFMGVCRHPKDESRPFRRLDIRLCPCDQYYCAVLYFTGSDLFNQNMRAYALEKKFTLNEYSLRRLTSEGVSGEPEPVDSEEAIFRILGLDYKKPEERDL